MSKKALLMLYEMKSPAIEVNEPSEYYGGRKDWEAQFEKDKKREFWPPVVSPDGKILTAAYGDELRTDPALIKVVKKLGEEANDEYAELKIVEIPDGTKFEIDDYDGIETIHEVHRSWS